MSEETLGEAATRESVALGLLIVALERRFPGIALETAEMAECEFARATMIRLRGPRTAPLTLKAIDEATAFLERISGLAAKAAPKEPERRKWFACGI